MWNKQDVCAVIVSYNDSEAVIENLRALENQVDRVLIVDNGSNEDVVRALESINSANMTLRLLGENKGIAFALNNGLSFAVENQYPFLLTMDQDSILPPDGVQTMLGCLAALPSSYAAVGPYIEGIYGQDKKDSIRTEDKNFLITSGNLIKTTCTSEIGGFQDKLFIDDVDFDFSLNLRSHGYRLAICNDCQMQHHLGQAQHLKGKTVSVHSPMRKYYKVRNHRYLMKHYFFKFPVYMLYKSIQMLKTILMWLYYEPNRSENWNSIKKGLKEHIK